MNNNHKEDLNRDILDQKLAKIKHELDNEHLERPLTLNNIFNKFNPNDKLKTKIKEHKKMVKNKEKEIDELEYPIKYEDSRVYNPQNKESENNNVMLHLDTNFMKW